MPDTCVVVGCSNIPDAEKGITLHKIPFYGDNGSEAKAGRKKWMDFVKLKTTATSGHLVKRFIHSVFLSLHS